MGGPGRQVSALPGQVAPARSPSQPLRGIIDGWSAGGARWRRGSGRQASLYVARAVRVSGRRGEEASGSRSIVVLTGAGISAESGLPTFRGNDGLWLGWRLEDVATPEAFARRPELVQRSMICAAGSSWRRRSRPMRRTGRSPSSSAAGRDRYR